MFIDFFETFINKPKYIFTKKITNLFNGIKIGYSSGLPILINSRRNVIASSKDRDYCKEFFEDHIKNLKAKKLPFIIISFDNFTKKELFEISNKYKIPVVKKLDDINYKSKQLIIDSSNEYEIFNIIQRNRIHHRGHRLVMFSLNYSTSDFVEKIHRIYTNNICFSIISSLYERDVTSHISYSSYTILLDKHVILFYKDYRKDILVDFIEEPEYPTQPVFVSYQF